MASLSLRCCTLLGISHVCEDGEDPQTYNKENPVLLEEAHNILRLLCLLLLLPLLAPRGSLSLTCLHLARVEHSTQSSLGVRPQRALAAGLNSHNNRRKSRITDLGWLRGVEHSRRASVFYWGAVA